MGVECHHDEGELARTAGPDGLQNVAENLRCFQAMSVSSSEVVSPWLLNMNDPR